MSSLGELWLLPVLHTSRPEVIILIAEFDNRVDECEESHFAGDGVKRGSLLCERPSLSSSILIR